MEKPTCVHQRNQRAAELNCCSGTGGDEKNALSENRSRLTSNPKEVKIDDGGGFFVGSSGKDGETRIEVFGGLGAVLQGGQRAQEHHFGKLRVEHLFGVGVVVGESA